MARYLFKEIKCEIRNWDEKCQSKVTGHFHELILKSRIQTQPLTECEKVVQLEFCQICLEGEMKEKKLEATQGSHHNPQFAIR